VYGYRLEMMSVTGAVNTATAKAGQFTAPVNQFAKYQNQASPAETSIPAPPTNVLVASVWMDVSRGPLVLSVPKTAGRYYLVQICDFWTNSQSLGTRTTGGAAQAFAFVGPHWKGRLPAGMKRVRLPTKHAWTFISTQFNGPADVALANQFQGGYQLTPLRRWGRKYTPPSNVPVNPKVDTTTTPAAQVGGYSAEKFLRRLPLLMGPNPPARRDAPVLAQLARIGLVPGKPFDWAKLSRRQRAAADVGVAKARLAIDRAGLATPGSKVINGWLVANNYGRYGTQYLLRAAVALIGLGAELPRDQMYPVTLKDSDGNPLNGTANACKIHFAPGQFPPTNAIWSLTLYDGQLHLSANSINRYDISPNQQQLTYNADGSLDIFMGPHRSSSNSRAQAEHGLKRGSPRRARGAAGRHRGAPPHTGWTAVSSPSRILPRSNDSGCGKRFIGHAAPASPNTSPRPALESPISTSARARHAPSRLQHLPQGSQYTRSRPSSDHSN
jgi:hypothetical protein